MDQTRKCIPHNVRIVNHISKNSLNQKNQKAPLANSTTNLDEDDKVLNLIAEIDELHSDLDYLTTELKDLQLDNEGDFYLLKIVQYKNICKAKFIFVFSTSKRK